MSPERIPACPKCHSPSSVYPAGERNWTCLSCKWTFDGDPDEGGTHMNNPTKRIERDEIRQANRREYAKRRGDAKRRGEYAKRRRQG